MAVFFVLVGLALKRGLLAGELSDKRNSILPAAGAVGGTALHAITYRFFNMGGDITRKADGKRFLIASRNQGVTGNALWSVGVAKPSTIEAG